VPDIIANHVLPGSYDGQIELATNTAGYDPTGDMDTFLASFDGDLDTATCKVLWERRDLPCRHYCLGKTGNCHQCP
jgi:hypothetical protein